MELSGKVVDVGTVSPFEQIICVDLGSGELGFDLTIPKRLGIDDVAIGDTIHLITAKTGSIADACIQFSKQATEKEGS